MTGLHWQLENFLFQGLGKALPIVVYGLGCQGWLDLT